MSRSAKSAPDGTQESADSGSAVDQLKTLIDRLSAAVDELKKPLDGAEATFVELENFLMGVDDESRDEVIGVVVGVINTGDVQVSIESSLNEEVVAGAQQIGLKVRELLSSLAATGERAKLVGTAAKDTLLRVPELSTQAMATAQLTASNPLAGAQARANAAADLTRIQNMVQGIQTQMADIQQQALTLPPRAAELGARAQKILLGAELKPPTTKDLDPALAALVEPVLGGVVAAAVAACPEVAAPIEAKPPEHPFQWGWFLLAGLSAGVTGVGVGIYANAHLQVNFCEDPNGFGCSNYDQLRSQEAAGLVMLSSGAALTSTFLVSGIIVNARRNRDPAKELSLSCGSGIASLSCRGTF